MPDDGVIWQIEGDHVIVCRAHSIPDPFVGDFESFSEWSSAVDCEAFDRGCCNKARATSPGVVPVCRGAPFSVIGPR
jgi:hypothetical protein